jgi:hypothetical protein
MPLSGARMLVILALIAVASIVLWIPVLGDRLKAEANRLAPKVAPRVFLLGLAVLLAGLVIRMKVLDIIGGCLIGGLALAVLLNEY